jgi:hypothetical protein
MTSRLISMPLFIFPLTAFVASSFAATPGDEAYCLPLIGPYAIHHEDQREGGSTELVEVPPPGPGLAFSWHTILPDVKQVAVEGNIIVGRTSSQFFVFDTHRRVKPELLDSPEVWQSALARAGVPGGIRLSNPDALAAGVSERVLRPWNFRMMRGWLGYSDDQWSFIVQLAGLIVAVCIGFFGRPGRFPLVALVMLGIVIDFGAQFVILGGGPGACVGLVGYPIWACIGGLFGKGLRVPIAGILLLKNRRSSPDNAVAPEKPT